MPIYEYEPEDRDCLMCEGRVQVIQGIQEDPLSFCPWCGLEVKRVVSRVSFRFAKDASPDRAAQKGLTTFRRSERGVWEKVAGPGVDAIVSSPEDVAAVDAEQAPPAKKLDLDQES